MEIKYNVSGKKRKELVEAISKILGEDAKYKGAPSFSYEVGEVTIDKTGTVESEATDIQDLKQKLIEYGFFEDLPIDGLVIELPIDGFTEKSIENLKTLVQAKGKLIKKALGVESLPIEEREDKLSFPWFKGPLDSDSIKAYTHFLFALCELAKNQKRVVAKEKEIQNDKYAFRCFLLRLGFIGDEYKGERKILLSRLEGSSAFKAKGETDDE